MAFYGKVAFITGGASGIGRLHALRLAATGAKVAIIDMNETSLAEVAQLSSNIIPFRCDVTDLEQVRATVDKVEREIGAIDRLINCAAIMPGGILLESQAPDMNKIMLINYCGMVNVCQSVIPKMLKRNTGDVIIYGSTAGIIPSKKFGAYGATKAANNFYTKVLMSENKNSKLRFQLVCPPAVDTPLINQAKDSGPDFLKDIQKTRKNLVSPELVVDSVEKCLESNIQINYPGPAKWFVLAYRFFPRFVERMANK